MRIAVSSPVPGQCGMLRGLLVSIGKTETFDMTGILPSEFAGIAAQWGSLMRAGDPGSCLYGFGPDGLVRSERHRLACLEHIETECRRAADLNMASGDDPKEQHWQLDAMVAYLKTCPVSGADRGLDAFETAYVKAALFNTNDGSDESRPLDDDYGPEHLSDEAVARVKEDCGRFRSSFGHLVTEENCRYRGCPVEEYAAHDFWLTRCGHGSGFWDGDWKEPAAGILTDGAHAFGEIDLVPGDDGRLHLEGGHPSFEESPASSAFRP